MKLIILISLLQLVTAKWVSDFYNNNTLSYQADDSYEESESYSESESYESNETPINNTAHLNRRTFFGASRDDIVFKLYTRGHNESFEELKYRQFRYETIVKPDKPFKFITHGFLDSASDEFFLDMKKAFLTKEDCNVVMVDWSKAAFGEYSLVRNYTPTIGKFVSDIIVDLHTIYTIPLSSFHLVGHSLGAHISGFAGKTVQEATGLKVGRITGLDPAGPLFKVGATRRLNSTDAVFVDIIHTDGDKYGHSANLGTVDFYPNGGRSLQPGCLMLSTGNFVADVVACSHIRAVLFFTESINSNGFIARKCTNNIEFNEINCPSFGLTAIMGNNVDPAVKGVYYLSTNAFPPFATNGEISFNLLSI